MVMETDILSRGMSLNKIFMSSTESMATPSGWMENKTGYNQFQGFVLYCYETIMFGRVTHARRRCKARALSV